MAGQSRILAVVATAALIGGCAKPTAVADSAARLVRAAVDQMKPKPYSAESNLALTDEERTQRLVLDEDQQEAALAAMRSIAVDHDPSNRLRPAPFGVRWSDVPLAVRYAGEEVEAAIVRQRGRIEDDEIRFLLTTIDGRLVELTVTRTHDERVYEASASVGRFGTDTDREQAFLHALEKQLRLLGRKRRFE